MITWVQLTTNKMVGYVIPYLPEWWGGKSEPGSTSADSSFMARWWQWIHVDCTAWFQQEKKLLKMPYTCSKVEYVDVVFLHKYIYSPLISVVLPHSDFIPWQGLIMHFCIENFTVRKWHVLSLLVLFTETCVTTCIPELPDVLTSNEYTLQLCLMKIKQYAVLDKNICHQTEKKIEPISSNIYRYLSIYVGDAFLKKGCKTKTT